MSRCPCCNNELEIVEGSIKFAVQLAEGKKEEDCCEMPERVNSEGIQEFVKEGREKFINQKDEVKK